MARLCCWRRSLVQRSEQALRGWGRASLSHRLVTKVIHRLYGGATLGGSALGSHVVGNKACQHLTHLLVLVDVLSNLHALANATEVGDHRVNDLDDALYQAGILLRHRLPELAISEHLTHHISSDLTISLF